MALVAPVRPRPVDQHDQPVAEADQEEDVHGQPEPPGEQAGQLEPASRRPRPCDRSWRGCRSRGSGMRGPACPAGARGSPRATCAPICFAAGATPGTGLPSCCTLARSPATKISGWPGTLRSRPTGTRPARSRGDAEQRAQRRGGDAGGPQHRARRHERARPARNRVRIDRADRRARDDFDAELLQLPARALSDSDSGNEASTRGPASTRRTLRMRRDRCCGTRA